MEGKSRDRLVMIQSEADGVAAVRLMDGLRLRKQLCDVSLVVEEERFEAHRVVLAAHSPYFLAMFTGAMAECQKGEIEIHGCEAETMREIIDYFYTSRLEITPDNAQSLLAAASMLQLPDVLSSSAEFISTQLDASNCLAARALGDAYGCEELWKAAESYALQHFDDVVGSDEFTSLSPGLVTELLSRDTLCVQREEQVFEAALRWVQHDPTARRAHLATVLKSVRLPHVAMEYLVDSIETCDLVRRDIDCRDLIDKAKNYVLLTERRASLGVAQARPSTLGLVFVVGGMNDSEQALASMDCVQLGADSQIPEVEDCCGGLPSTAQTGRLHIARSALAVGLLEGSLYAVGGHSASEHGFLASVERFDPSTGAWTLVQPMDKPRRYVGVAVLDDRLYAVGGSNQVSSTKMLLLTKTMFHSIVSFRHSSVKVHRINFDCWWQTATVVWD